MSSRDRSICRRLSHLDSRKKKNYKVPSQLCCLVGRNVSKAELQLRIGSVYHNTQRNIRSAAICYIHMYTYVCVCCNRLHPWMMGDDESISARAPSSGIIHIIIIIIIIPISSHSHAILTLSILTSIAAATWHRRSADRVPGKLTHTKASEIESLVER